ncbi:hypothetical protein OHA63_19080 [Streptomyces anulatus]|uniref:hypothetical protein n=1 Tax=Streptomyces TaxID=1883 RepID=UPI002E2EE347|nr:hypothetical protein [Streptomyces anulatus]
MSEGSRSDRYPHPESLKAVRGALGVNNAVSDYTEVAPHVYKIFRTGKTDVVVYVTNIYTVGVADVQEILEEHPSVTCILTVSAWNHYTGQAKDYAKSISVGLFKFYEWMGALNYDGHAFLDYIAPRDRE